MNDPWYVVISKQGQETLAKRELRNQSFEVYLPLCIADWAKKPRIRPLLPSYLFVRMSQENARWRSMLSTYGVRTMIYSGDRPQAVSAWIVDEIQTREVDGLVRLPPRIQTKHKHGDSVAIKGSPMQAVFDEVVDHRRAAVFLSLLGQTKRKIIDLSRLTSLPQSISAVA